MGASLQQIHVLRISGALRKEELDAAQAEGLKGLVGREDDEFDAKVLVLVEEDFSGWVGREEWNDLTFFLEHGDKIAKMALVANPRWEAELLVFAGDGLRRAPVRFFPRAQLAAACSWLLE